MPRRKKLDVSSLFEAFLSEIDARVGRALAEAVRDLHQRIDRLERNLSGRGKESAVQSFRVCRKPGCNSRVIAHGLCSRHYQQWRYHARKAGVPTSGDEVVAAAGAPRKPASRKAADASAGKASTARKRTRAPRAARTTSTTG
jgi:hypothetical protein